MEKEEYRFARNALITIDKEAKRVSGIVLRPDAYQRVAFLLLGDYHAVQDAKNINVTYAKPMEFAPPGYFLWHVRVGNAHININPEDVMFHFDMPLKEASDERETAT